MKDLTKSQKLEFGIGALLVLIVLVLGLFGVLSGLVLVKTLIGIGLGYALTRGNFGFAGLSNRACRTGSTKLLRGILLSVVIASIIVGALLISGATPKLYTKPISWGLLIGGTMFGIGMAFSSCCATGVLQDIPQGFVRAMVTLLFFGIGVFLGFPFWTSSIATQGAKINFYSLLTGAGLSTTVAVILAVLITIALAVIVAWLSKLYEKAVAKNFPTPEVEVEEVPATNYEKVFVKKWSMGTTAVVIAALVGLLFATTNAGWGASTVHGNWIGRLLVLFGADADALVSFTNGAAGVNFTGAFFSDASSWQNIGIILGAFVALLLSGNFGKTFTAGLKIKPIEIVLFALGGLLMGFGTRLSWGCNVGSLYSPISGFALNGWLYLFILFGAGYLGNIVYKWFYAKVVK